MNIEQQCCTFEQAKRLNELGVEQTSFFGWIEVDKPYIISKHTDKRELFVYNALQHITYAAFTVAELGLMLGSKCNQCVISRATGKWIVSNAEVLDWYHTQAECYAAYLIYLFTYNSITAEEVNQRLSA